MIVRDWKCIVGGPQSPQERLIWHAFLKMNKNPEE